MALVQIPAARLKFMDDSIDVSLTLEKRESVNFFIRLSRKNWDESEQQVWSMWRLFKASDISKNLPPSTLSQQFDIPDVVNEAVHAVLKGSGASSLQLSRMLVKMIHGEAITGGRRKTQTVT